jgi:hypothetical protein
VVVNHQYANILILYGFGKNNFIGEFAYTQTDYIGAKGNPNAIVLPGIQKSEK